MPVPLRGAPTIKIGFLTGLCMVIHFPDLKLCPLEKTPRYAISTGFRPSLAILVFEEII
jgi:hypothetical protein